MRRVASSWRAPAVSSAVSAKLRTESLTPQNLQTISISTLSTGLAQTFLALGSDHASTSGRHTMLPYLSYVILPNPTTRSALSHGSRRCVLSSSLYSINSVANIHAGDNPRSRNPCRTTSHIRCPHTPASTDVPTSTHTAYRCTSVELTYTLIGLP